MSHISNKKSESLPARKENKLEKAFGSPRVGLTGPSRPREEKEEDYLHTDAHGPTGKGGCRSISGGTSRSVMVCKEPLSQSRTTKGF